MPIKWIPYGSEILYVEEMIEFRANNEQKIFFYSESSESLESATAQRSDEKQWRKLVTKSSDESQE